MSFLAALHRLCTLSVHSWNYFFAGPYCCKVLAFHRFCFFSYSVLSFDDRNLSSIYTVSFTTFSNNVPSDDFQQQTTRLVTVPCTGCLVVQEFKMRGLYLHPNYIHVVCVPNQAQPGHCEFSADISYPPTRDWFHLGLSGMSWSVHIQDRPDWQHMHRWFYGHFRFLPFFSLECWHV